MSTEPDPWDDEPPERLAQPGITRAAGVLWIVMAVVFFVSGCLNIVASVMVKAQQNRPGAGTEGCATWLSFGIGAGLFIAGKNLLSGKSKDVLVASILSILLGLFYAALGVGAVFLLLGPLGPVALIAGVISLAVALGCILPGVLALAGRSQYLEWRRARRGRRSRRYEDEYDDRDDDRGDNRDDDRGDDGRASEDRPWDRGRT